MRDRLCGKTRVSRNGLGVTCERCSGDWKTKDKRLLTHDLAVTRCRKSDVQSCFLLRGGGNVKICGPEFEGILPVKASSQSYLARFERFAVNLRSGELSGAG